MDNNLFNTLEIGSKWIITNYYFCQLNKNNNNSLLQLVNKLATGAQIHYQLKTQLNNFEELFHFLKDEKANNLKFTIEINNQYEQSLYDSELKVINNEIYVILEEEDSVLKYIQLVEYLNNKIKTFLEQFISLPTSLTNTVESIESIDIQLCCLLYILQCKARLQMSSLLSLKEFADCIYSLTSNSTDCSMGDKYIESIYINQKNAENILLNKSNEVDLLKSATTQDFDKHEVFIKQNNTIQNSMTVEYKKSNHVKDKNYFKEGTILNDLLCDKLGKAEQINFELSDVMLSSLLVNFEHKVLTLFTKKDSLIKNLKIRVNGFTKPSYITIWNKFLRKLQDLKFDYVESTNPDLNIEHLKYKYTQFYSIFNFIEKATYVIKADNLVTKVETLYDINDIFNKFCTERINHLKQFKFIYYSFTNIDIIKNSNSILSFPSCNELHELVNTRVKLLEGDEVSAYTATLAPVLNKINNELLAYLIQTAYETTLAANANVSKLCLQQNQLQETTAFKNIETWPQFVFNNNENKLLCIILELFFNSKFDFLNTLKTFETNNPLEVSIIECFSKASVLMYNPHSIFFNNNLKNNNFNKCFIFEEKNNLTIIKVVNFNLYNLLSSLISEIITTGYSKRSLDFLFNSNYFKILNY